MINDSDWRGVDYASPIGVDSNGSTQGGGRDRERLDLDRIDACFTRTRAVVSHHVEQSGRAGKTSDIKSIRWANIVNSGWTIVNRSYGDGQSCIGRKSRRAVIRTANDKVHGSEVIQCWDELQRSVWQDGCDTLRCIWRGDQAQGDRLG